MRRFLDLHKKRYQILIFALISAVFVSCTLCLFLFQIKRFSEAGIYVTLEAVSEQRRHEIDSFFSRIRENLVVASFFFDMPQASYSDEEEIVEKLMACKINSVFDFLFYANLNGYCVNNAGEHYQIEELPFFKTNLEGRPFFSTSYDFSCEIDEIFSTISVPVFDSMGQITGIFGGICVQKTTNEILFHNSVENVSSYLLDDKHNIIACSEDINDKNSLLTYLEDEETEYGIEKTQAISIDKEKFFIYYDVIPNNNWKLVSVISEKNVSQRYGSVKTWSIIASFLNFFAFSIIIMVMVLIYTKHLNQIEAYAFLDPITKGISYQKFLEDAEKYINYHKTGNILAVCLDINDFRIFNDLYGFDEGNSLLKLVYKTLESYLSTGLVCRAANDTFYIITDFKASEKELVEKRDFFTDKFNTMLEKSKKPYHITFTVGFYQLEDQNAKVSVIFEKANHVHNCAKKEGISNFFYQESLRQGAIRQKMIENTMHEAFANLEFQMYLQPKYELISKSLVGAEALVRWESENSEHQYPNEFIPVFEKTGFIVQIDLYMMECTCQLLRHWIDFGIEPVPISVNQSKLLLLNPIYFNVITTTIEKYNLPPHLIEVEITETIMYDNAAILNDLIMKLHKYGIRVAIDDFGSGYSSLVLLRDIKADVLKIDKAFIYKAEKDLVGKKILSSIIQLADALNMQILAEGVETENQLSMLEDLGCHEVQGFLFGKPVPAQIFSQTFKKN